MSTEALGDMMRRMGRTAGLQRALSETDAQLLEQFVARRDEPAFAALMVRHGPMVLCLCRQMLHDAQEAEDAFQAAFLVLVRNAGSIRKGPSLGAWLYGVAYKVAARLRGRAERRQRRERPGFDLSAVPEAGDAVTPDLRVVLHEEIRRLPEKYRTPVVLCYLEGKTNDEAAHETGRPVGTVKARLSRARDLLRMRLARRGLGVAPLDEAPPAARHTASVVPALLLHSTLKAAMRLAAKGVGGGWATARAAGLARTVVAAMQLAKLKGTAALLLAVFVLGAGSTSISYLSPAAAPATADAAPSPAPAAAADNVAEAPAAGAVGADARPAVIPPNVVCKRDAVQRLRDMVEEFLLGPKTHGATADPRSQLVAPDPDCG